MNLIYGEIGVVSEAGDQVLIVCQVRGVAAIQTKVNGPQYLPQDAQIFILLDGPAAHWAKAMARLGMTHVSVFDYGEAAYMLEEQLQQWLNGQVDGEKTEPLPELR